MGKIDSVERDNASGLKRLVYLVKALTFSDWQPRPRDFEVILGWLKTSPLDSHHSHFARVFLSSLDWSVVRVNENVVERKLSRDVHVSVALAIVETFIESTSPNSTLTKSTSSNHLFTEGFR